MAIQWAFSFLGNPASTRFFAFQHVATDFTIHHYFPSGTVDPHDSNDHVLTANKKSGCPI